MVELGRLQLARTMLHQVSEHMPLQQVAAGLENYRNAAAARPMLESMGATEDPPSEELDALRGDQLEGAAMEALDSLVRDGLDAPLNDEQQFALEAIVLPRYRPVVNIVNNTFAAPPDPWSHLGDGLPKQRIDGVIRSIGRIEVPRHPRLIPYAGTGFVVGKLAQRAGDGGPIHLMMTNRHVAELFATGLGQRNLSFHQGQRVEVDFKREIVPSPPALVKVQAVVTIHPYWDMALLHVAGLPDDHPVMSLSTEDPRGLVDRDVVVIGYPAQDSRNDLDLQNRIFGGIYEVKRMQPGKLKVREDCESYGNSVNALTHDSSTLGGNSGSAVIEFADSAPEGPARVVGLHFAGKYLKANYAVPTFDLAQDSRVVDTGVNFTGRVEPRNDFYGPIWIRADSAEGVVTSGSATPRTAVQSLASSVNVPAT